MPKPKKEKLRITQETEDSYEAGKDLLLDKCKDDLLSVVQEGEMTARDVKSLQAIFEHMALTAHDPEQFEQMLTKDILGLEFKQEGVEIAEPTAEEQEKQEELRKMIVVQLFELTEKGGLLSKLSLDLQTKEMMQASQDQMDGQLSSATEEIDALELPAALKKTFLARVKKSTVERMKEAKELESPESQLREWLKEFFDQALSPALEGILARIEIDDKRFKEIVKEIKDVKGKMKKMAEIKQSKIRTFFYEWSSSLITSLIGMAGAGAAAMEMPIKPFGVAWIMAIGALMGLMAGIFYKDQKLEFLQKPEFQKLEKDERGLHEQLKYGIRGKESLESQAKKFEQVLGEALKNMPKEEIEKADISESPQGFEEDEPTVSRRKVRV